MCLVVQHAYRKCHHHHHWEPAIECDSGFNSTREECNVGDHQVIRGRYLPNGHPLFCRTCFNMKVQWIRQAFYVMLIKLKAATVAQSSGTAELEWRYRTWKVQYAKELLRLALSCGYPVPDASLAGNVNEDELDPDWHFQLPQALVRAKLRYLNERFSSGVARPAEDFWQDRPNLDYDPMTILSDEETSDEESEETTEEDDDEGERASITDDEGDSRSEPSGREEHNCVCGEDPCVCRLEETTDSISPADIAAAGTLLNLFMNTYRDIAVYRPTDADNNDNPPEEQSDGEDDDDDTPGPPESSLNPPTHPESDSNSEG